MELQPFNCSLFEVWDSIVEKAGMAVARELQQKDSVFVLYQAVCMQVTESLATAFELFERAYPAPLKDN